MHKIKNVRPGMLVIPDVKLCLAPGETVECEELSLQMEKALSCGHLVKVEDHPAISSKEETAPESTAPESIDEPDAQETDISKLTAQEVVDFISKEENAAWIKDHLPTEKRRTVIDAMKKRLKEVDGGAD